VFCFICVQLERGAWDRQPAKRDVLTDPCFSPLLRPTCTVLLGSRYFPGNFVRLLFLSSASASSASSSFFFLLLFRLRRICEDDGTGEADNNVSPCGGGSSPVKSGSNSSGAVVTRNRPYDRGSIHESGRNQDQLRNPPPPTNPLIQWGLRALSHR
jgi:hypothetical protein